MVDRSVGRSRARVLRRIGRHRIRFGFQVPVSASVSDALPIRFRVRVSVSEPARAPPRVDGPGGAGRVVAEVSRGCAGKPQNAPKHQHGLPTCKDVEDTTIQGKPESRAEAKSTPEPRMEARTEPKKQVENETEAKTEDPGEALDRTETEAEDEAHLVPELLFTR